MMSLTEGLSRVLTDYAAAKASALTDHPLAAFVRGDMVDLITECLPDRRGYKVKGSVGVGNWAETPWISVFDLRP